MFLKSGIQIYQIFTNDDKVCIRSLSSIVIAVLELQCHKYIKPNPKWNLVSRDLFFFYMGHSLFFLVLVVHST